MLRQEEWRNTYRLQLHKLRPPCTVPAAAAQWNDEEAQQDCLEKNKCPVSFPIIPECQCSDIPPVVSFAS